MMSEKFRQAFKVCNDVNVLGGWLYDRYDFYDDNYQLSGFIFEESAELCWLVVEIY